MKWEYLILYQRHDDQDEGELNEVGAKGWELVSAVSIAHPVVPHAHTVCFYFKRPVTQTAEGRVNERTE